MKKKICPSVCCVVKLFHLSERRLSSGYPQLPREITRRHKTIVIDFRYSNFNVRKKKKKETNYSNTHINDTTITAKIPAVAHTNFANNTNERRIFSNFTCSQWGKKKQRKGKKMISLGSPKLHCSWEITSKIITFLLKHLWLSWLWQHELFKIFLAIIIFFDLISEKNPPMN